MAAVEVQVPTAAPVEEVAQLAAASAVKVKGVMHSQEDESKMEEEERTERTERADPFAEHKKRDPGLLPFLKTPPPHKPDPEDEKPAEKARQQHPNEMIFPLIYKQAHINSMFKFGENWYTWSTEKRTDGSKAINYYICYDEPKRCDEIGWERTDALPKCAFQIDSLMPEDRACLNPFGVEPHNSGACDGAVQMKVSEMVRACGPRIRSLWRFLRVGRRPAGAAKPADVNSLVCEDEEECFITIEYRIHHDRITFSLHEPSRGQTFKSALKRDAAAAEEEKSTAAPERPRVAHRAKKPREEERADGGLRTNKFHARPRSKVAEGKGVVKERNDSGYSRRLVKNKIKIREDVSEDIYE